MLHLAKMYVPHLKILRLPLSPYSVVAPISLLLTDWLTISPLFEHVKLTT